MVNGVSMSHLVCEKCGGYYELKDGESPEDFEKCQCGGELRYIQNFDSHFDEEMDPLNEINICPSCGTENLANEKFCKSCDSLIKTENNKKNQSNPVKTIEESKSQKNIIIRFLVIIAGILIVLVPSLLIFDQNYVFVLLLIGGFIVGLLTGKDSEEIVLNGAIVGLIAGLILLIFRSNILYSGDGSYIEFLIFEIVGPLLILIMFALFGALIAILVKYLAFEYKKNEVKN